ncbi:MAG TPA: hypothetical protein VM344_06125, partial [Vitreimonas sp.]|nr:hypothetical protein [Vitreimonas sp.]
MLTQRLDQAVRFTRRDAGRLGLAAAVLALVLTLILGIDIIVPQALSLNVGDVARADINAPRAVTYESEVRTDALREEARQAVPPQYDYTPGKGDAVAAEQLGALRRALIPVQAAFRPSVEAAERQAILAETLPQLSDEPRATLVALSPERWPLVRMEAERVLGVVQRNELRDAQVAQTRQGLIDRMGGGLSAAERLLAAEII